MSRLFNQTKKALDWSLRESIVKDPEVERVLEAFQSVDTQVVDVPKSRFYDCRQFQLSSADGRPLVSNDRVSKALAGEAYRGLRTRLMQRQARQGLKSVVLSSTLPGEGKTLTTMNLALSFVRLADPTVLVVDADLRTCGLTELMGNPPGPGLAEVLEGTTAFQDAVVSTDIRNLYTVPAGMLKGSAPELFASPRWKEFMAWSSEAFKVILVDAPSVLPLADFELITAACDGVLMVVRAQRTPRERLREAGRHIDPNKLIGVVFNGTEDRKQNGHERYFAAQ
jgi:protein-tyrosine kinase